MWYKKRRTGLSQAVMSFEVLSIHEELVVKSPKKNVVIPGPEENWKQFDWINFPGGVKVTLALLRGDGTGIYLLPFNRHSHSLPSVYVKEPDCLVDVVRKLSPEGCAKPESYKEIGYWIDEERKTLHLVLSTVYLLSGVLAFVPRTTPHMLGTLADVPLSDFLQEKLGWTSLSEPLAAA